MKKINPLLILAFLLINIIIQTQAIGNIRKESLKEGTIYTIDEAIDGTTEYKTKTVSFESTDTINYLTYDFGTSIPTSAITAFRLDITPFSSTMSDTKILCANVLSTSTDSEIKTAIDTVKSDETKSTCVHISQNEGVFDTLVKLDSTNTKVVIGVYIPANQLASAKINFRITERILAVTETTPTIVETYSIVPVSVNTQTFRNSDKKASKILFYSNKYNLQMYEAVSSNSPVQLFSGNIMNVYTNIEMIRQKYHSASIMTLLISSTDDSSQKNNLEASYTIQVVCLESSFLLDYYVSSNPDGRAVNTPLLINMTDCSSPYYVILNYNKKDTAKTLIMDEIYGKLSFFGIATSLTQEFWEDMINYDIKSQGLNDGRYDLPANSENHLDVYKFQCTLPIMLNFYYIDESSQSSELNAGDVHVFILNPYADLNVPFVEGIAVPEIIIEIHHPEDSPNVEMQVGSLTEKTYTQNTLERFTPMSITEGINIKERGGSSTTRVIIKVGFPTNSWIDKSQFIKYNSENDIYLYEFPKDVKESFYTFANLTISGTNTDDNVKFCFTSSIGGPLKPSSENCYRVSKTNSYTLRFYNPFIMYKTYDYSKDLKYSITFKPTTTTQNFGIIPHLSEYDTTIRNYEGVNNKITIDGTNRYSSILTPPKNNPPSVFLQIQVCDDDNGIGTEVLDVLTGEVLLAEERIDAGKKNYYRTFSNRLMDTEFYAMGQENAVVFLRMVGLNTMISPSFNDNYEITFDTITNTLNVGSPLNTNENLKITVLIDKENVLVNNKYTLCSFVDTEFKDLALYYKTVSVTSTKSASIHINFNEAGLNPGDTFDALVYYEQQTKGQMVFLSKVNQFIVGELNSIYEINKVEGDFAYAYVNETSNNYYFSYAPPKVFDVPIGSLGVIVESGTGDLSGVYCAFVSNDSDIETMIDAVEKVIEDGTSYCYGSQSTVDSKRYNYIFKYEYENNQPKKLVVKVANAKKAEVDFNIYVKQSQGVQIEKTDFTEQKEYGKDESDSKTVIPYIVDLESIRGDTSGEYVSKVLFYSKFLELQMFYLADNNNSPIKLFSGNIALVYTKPELAEQKYHSKVLILISENLEGKSHPSIGASFRFHTKMFNSQAMIEFFVSQNPSGRTLNFPLSLEMTTCESNNNKLYYLLNYNEEEAERTLHLDMIFGKYTRARIATAINEEKWDDLLSSSSMELIEDYKKDLPTKSQHLDVIEVECSTPLLLNAYYTKNTMFYADVEKGGVAIKLLDGGTSYDFSLKKGSDDTVLEYSISIFSAEGNPDISITFSDGSQHQLKGNSIQTGFLMNIPERVKIINNGEYATRFIFKYGYYAELSGGWTDETPSGVEGTLFTKDKTHVYKFPVSNKQKNYKTVSLTVNPKNGEENVKFCYSTNIGTPIASSRENCFRTGKTIPYTLTFVNPFIMGKDYSLNTNKYYVTFTPFDDTGEILIAIQENKYDTETRNELGVAKKLTLSNVDVSSILTMPDQPLPILFQIQACKSSSFADSDYILYNDSNAYTGQNLHSGKTYFRDSYGSYFIPNLKYMENKVTIYRDKSGADIDVFLKHASLSNDYTPIINENYALTFDDTSNVLSIVKPILGEAFSITVIVDKKETTKSLTICDLAFNFDKSKYDYVNTFISTTSDNVIHRIDFSSLSGYTEGTTFYAVVFAEQSQNSKMSFIYPILEAKVGKITGCLKIDKEVEEGKNEYMTTDFTVKSTGNYLYYDFGLKPTGNVASLRIVSEQRVLKVGCTFVDKNADDETMQNAVNVAMREGTSCCVFEPQASAGEFNALVSANYPNGKNRLVIQVLYGFGEGEEVKDSGDAKIVLKTKGTELTSQGEQTNQESNTVIPYVIPLVDIREKSGKDYVSKILFYSNSKEMEMLYIPDDNSAPVSLFTGNIMLVYTNPELIKQKYQGAETMILLAKILTKERQESIGNIRFVTYFFNSATNIQYFLSSNSEGRPLNNPTAIEMTSCTQPYYYIMNYNKNEGERKLHIDTIYGEKKSIRIATALNKNTWEGLIEGMEEISGEEIILDNARFHFDVIEVTCNVPLLLNLYYVDPENTKVDNLIIGDMTILSLSKGQEQTLTFVNNGSYFYVYSFTVENEARKPKLLITFNGAEDLSITEEGVYTHYSMNQYSNLKISNVDTGGNSPTRIIFKYGYAIEGTFKKDENGVYNNKDDPYKKYNLYGYIYDSSSSKLDFTGVDFEISTDADNVKFCYSTNLGIYIYPSLQNCYRVGKSNPYTISTLNPNVMYRNYAYDDHINYYVAFRTVDINQEIKIKPSLKKYDTNLRLAEGNNNVLTITNDNGALSTILTAPKTLNNYISIEYCLCTQKAHASYQLFNAYNNTNLGYNGEINDNNPKFITIENTKLDTELKITNAKKGYEMFVKHTGISLNKKRIASAAKIKITYDENKKMLNWTQPIQDQNFTYTLFFNKIDVMKKQYFTLCNTTTGSKLGEYKTIISTNSKTPGLDIGKERSDMLNEYGDFDVIIIAEEVGEFKITLISATYDSKGGNNEPAPSNEIIGDDDDNTGLVVLISILSVVIIGGIIVAAFIFYKYRSKGQVIKENKQTSMALLNSTKEEKMVESTVQVDP